MEPARKLDWPLNMTLSELIEAAIRTGHRQEAAAALEQLNEITRPSGTNWGLGIQARCRALLSEPDLAEPLYQEAIQRLTQTRVRGEHARAHLLYGEWLRREGRRIDARAQLQIAYDMFTAMRIEAFAERTRHELLATGATARKRDHQSRADLTPQEEQIAKLARGGLSNPEIGERLFLSPRTVEWHLKKVFAKLGIKSRMALHEALPSPDHKAARA
jgi:DNA-binding CsgD family transcriptional regulator